MRLGPLLLTGAALAAQAPNRDLPWDRATVLPWRAIPSGDFPAQPASPTPLSSGPLRVVLNPDGALRVLDGRGIVHLRTGLPGRPRKLWRDAGLPLSGASGSWAFPAETPLRGGIGALPLGQADFRPGLQGTLWILDDEERLLTLVHPATFRLVYLPLPGSGDLELAFLPDQLVLRQGTAGSGNGRGVWSLPWLSLLPQFILLGTPLPAPKPGTALQPFPKE